MDNEEKLVKLSKPMREAVEKIIGRCEKSGIEYEWRSVLRGGYDLLVYIQQGRGKHRILVYGVNAAEELLDSDFEKYVFVEGYLEAICCYEEGCVEAIVGSIGAPASKTVILGELTGTRTYKDFKEMAQKIKEGVDVRLKLAESGDKGVRISIGKPSKALLAMVNYLDEEEALAVRVEGLKIRNSKEVAEQLGRVTNSLFFELRKKRGIGLFVKRQYDVEVSLWGREEQVRRKLESDLDLPKFEYDKEPIELYWHAVSAYKMPLLQYLAYYQILESYFMKYSMLEAKKEIRNCLKDPVFDVDDENDIVKIVASVTSKLGPRVSEKDMLCDTVRGCMSREELVSELSSEPLKDYFKNDYKLVSQFRVSEEKEEIEIREQLAARIYDIRCRIVHTKEDDKRGRIMPFTKDEVLLGRFDLPMIESLADKVLIANSKKLSL
jgi:hypothetical protein